MQQKLLYTVLSAIILELSLEINLKVDCAIVLNVKNKKTTLEVS